MKNLTALSLAAATTLASSFSPPSFSSLHVRVPTVPALSAAAADAAPSESESDISNTGESPSSSSSSSSRRSALKRMGGASLASAFFPAVAANADDGDLTSQLFNADGSLKEGQVVEAKSKVVATTFPGGSGESSPGKKALVSVDGAAAAPTGGGGTVKVSYELPEKWGDASTGYLDKSEGVNAKSADRITVFQLAGPAEIKTLDKASTIGVAKALGIETLPQYNPSILKADLVSGRRSNREGIAYYEYDLAVAPASCVSGQKEDLGLGFCPYDSIVLLSAAVVDGRMYGIMVECDRDEWKKGNADLKRVRSSFQVDSELELLEK